MLVGTRETGYAFVSRPLQYSLCDEAMTEDGWSIRMSIYSAELTKKIIAKWRLFTPCIIFVILGNGLRNA